MEFYIILWHFYINWEQMGIILPSDELILFRGVGIPPTRCALFNLGAIILQVVISLEAKWSQGWPLKMATTLMAAGHWFLSRRLFVLLRFQSTNLVNRYIYIYTWGLGWYIPGILLFISTYQTRPVPVPAFIQQSNPGGKETICSCWIGLPNLVMTNSSPWLSHGPNRNRWFTELENGWIFPWRC